MIKGIQDEHEELKEDTEQFKQFNKKIEKRKEEINKKQPLKVNTVEKTFAKLIHDYKQKGYSIPDLSPRKNLFKPSPLLLENSKITDYYRFFCKDKENDKNQHFVDKISEIVTTRKMQSEIDSELKETARHKIMKNRLSIAAARRSSILHNIVEEKDLSRENIKLEKENSEIRKKIYMHTMHNETTESVMTNSFRSSKRPSENKGRKDTNSSFNMSSYKSNKQIGKSDLNLPQARGSILKPVNRHTSSKNFKLENKNEILSDPIKTEDRLAFNETAGSTNYTVMKNTIEDKSTIETQVKMCTPIKVFKRLQSNKNINLSPKSNQRSPHSNKNLLYKKKMSKFALNTEEHFFPKINETATQIETRESTQPTYRETLEDKNTFLENFMTNFNLDKMNLNDLKNISGKYCKKYMNLSDLQIEQKIDK